MNEEILTLFLPEPISSNNREIKFTISSTYFLKEILLFSNPIFIENEKHIFEKKNSCDIDKGLVTEGTKTDRKNFPCPFFTCFSYFKSVSLFRDHCSSFHPDFPIIFSFSLTKFQTDEKGILVDFMNSLYKTNSYKSKYSPEGRKSNNKKTTNIFTCNNLGNKFNCPSFFKFIKSSNNFDFTVSFSLVHNHSEYTRKSLPANIRTELRAILENYEKHTYIDNLEKKDILLKTTRKKLSQLTNDPDAIYAIITKRYLNAQLASISNYLERPSNFITLFMSAIENINLGDLQLEKLSEITILVAPKIIKTKSLIPKK